MFQSFVTVSLNHVCIVVVFLIRLFLEISIFYSIFFSIFFQYIAESIKLSGVELHAFDTIR